MSKVIVNSYCIVDRLDGQEVLQMSDISRTLEVIQLAKLMVF